MLDCDQLGKKKTCVFPTGIICVLVKKNSEQNLNIWMELFYLVTIHNGITPCSVTLFAKILSQSPAVSVRVQISDMITNADLQSNLSITTSTMQSFKNTHTKPFKGLITTCIRISLFSFEEK